MDVHALNLMAECNGRRIYMQGKSTIAWEGSKTSRFGNDHARARTGDLISVSDAS